MVRSLPALIALFLCLPALADENWPQFGGPRAHGHSDSTGLPLTWSETQNIKWKTPIPGQGWSSPVIWGNQVWLTTATGEGRSLRAICVDKTTGAILRDVEVFAPAKVNPKNAFNSFASPTPAIEEGRIYICFGNYGSACFDTATGACLWKNQELKLDHMEGPGSSPILYKDLYILDCDGIDTQYIAALDKRTGRLAWKTPRTADFAKISGVQRKAFGTPLLASIGGQDQLIDIAARRVYGYDPLSGRELWHCDIRGFSNANRAVVGDGLLFIGSGYDRADLYALRSDSLAGDVSKTHIVWKYTQGIPQKPTMLLIDDTLWLIADTGVVRSLKAKTGELIWSKRVCPNVSASPLYADGRIYIFSERGESVVLKPASPEPAILAQNTLEAGCMGTPAISGKVLYIRTKTHLYRVEQ